MGSNSSYLTKLVVCQLNVVEVYAPFVHKHVHPNGHLCVISNNFLADKDQHVIEHFVINFFSTANSAAVFP